MPADNWPQPVDVHPTTKYSERTDCQSNKKQGRSEAQGVSIQVAILKVLASHDGGRATTASLKRDVAILAASGPEWGARMRRLAGRVATIDILASSYALWDGDGWQITSDGRDFLRALEAVTRDNRPAEAGQPEADDAEDTARPPARPRAAPIVVGHRFKSRRLTRLRVVA